MNHSLFYMLLFIFIPCCCDSYKILAIFPYNGRSHMNVLEHVAKALATRGHQIDVISHFPLKKSFPNYTDIYRLPDTVIAKVNYSTIDSVDIMMRWIRENNNEMCSYLGLNFVSNLVREEITNPTYDLLLVHDINALQCFTAIAYKLKIPVVNVITTKPYPSMSIMIGNPINAAVSPCYTLRTKNTILTFWDRLKNFYYNVMDINEFYGVLSDQDYYIAKYVGSDVPDHRQLEKTTALVLANSHYSFFGVEPKTPAIVEIGGIHIKNDTSPMDSELQELLDDSMDGFIYLSFGTNVIIESLPTKVLERLYTAFRKISPIKIIMKVSKPELMPNNVPSNVIMFRWLPQMSILQHRNIKAFITHAGGLGSQEAIHSKVPMICMPFFADQNQNCDLLVRKNIGLNLDYKTAQQTDYDYALEEIVSNPIYKATIDKVSSEFWDRPRSPAEETVYWVEYVIRHGANALRSPSRDLEWWQFELFDVYAFVTTCLIVLLGIIMVILYQAFLLLIISVGLARGKFCAGGVIEELEKNK